MIISKVIPNSVSPIRKICFIFVGTLCSLQGKNDNKLLDTECYHLISLSTYIYLTKKTYEPLSLRVVPISENVASGPRTNVHTKRLSHTNGTCSAIYIFHVYVAVTSVDVVVARWHNRCNVTLKWENRTLTIEDVR